MLADIRVRWGWLVESVLGKWKWQRSHEKCAISVSRLNRTRASWWASLNKKRPDRVETIGNGIINEILLCFVFLLVRRQSGNKWTILRVSKEKNHTRDSRLSTTRMCSRLRVIVIDLFFPLPVSIQFKNAPVPEEKKERIDRFDGIYTIVVARKRSKNFIRVFPRLLFSRYVFYHVRSFRETIPRNIYTRVAYYLW